MNVPLVSWRFGPGQAGRPPQLEVLGLQVSSGRSKQSRDNYSNLARLHIITDLAGRKLRDLSANDVDRWLAAKAKILR